jgi:hypothetical protein
MNRDSQTAQMREHLRQFYAQDPEEKLLSVILRHLEDPLRPTNAEGRFRPNPLLVLLGVIGALAAGTFLFFSLVHP